MRVIASVCIAAVMAGVMVVGPVFMGHPVSDRLKPSEEVVEQAAVMMETLNRFLDSAPDGLSGSDA